ncbi:hypothetical protein GCM10009678_91120 [Actinomadura kijaniata]|uniref:DUF3703 domain-containing protein n=1 Tax=Actinomadura namibiensis TaxID=182080 RepID=A0A7W3LMH8_ACTNM|nr:DUF3703 domain-containing protein [Actinomadura namibiensis]MBA8950843.1 hypothetical protein [Actinomadura namibiensis]
MAFTLAPMPAPVRAAFEAELRAARAARDLDAMWTALERAHILSQSWAWPHTRSHWHMFLLALRRRDRREAVGQAVRLTVAGPSSLLDLAPPGNTGRASVGLRTEMPVPGDLAALLAKA